MRSQIIIALLLSLFIKQSFGQEAVKPAFEKTSGANLPIGSKAPDFSMLAAGGRQIHLSDYKGKIVVLDVWATWCVPCRAELPKLDSLSQSYKGEYVVMLAVCSADSKDNFLAYLKNNQSKFACTFLFDEKGKVLEKASFRSVYGINGFPTTMVIDKAGFIKGYGFNVEEIKLLIQSVL